MKIFLSILLCAHLYCSAATSAENAGDAPSVVSQIDANISRGKAEFKSCGRFKKKFKKIISGGLNVESPSHLNKKQSLEYLAVLEKYPEPSQGYAKALDLFHENLDLLEKESNQAELLERLAKMENECAMFSMLVHASLLFKDVKAFEFSKKEKNRVEKLGKTYLTSGLPFHDFTEVGVKAGVLKSYLEHLFEGEGKEALVTRTAQLLQSFEAKRNAEAESNLKVKQEGKSETLEVYRYRWNQARELSAVYTAILKDAKL